MYLYATMLKWILHIGLGVTIFNRTKSGIGLNIANGVICDKVTGFSKAFLILFSKYRAFSYTLI